jgi:hypothetical protein
MKYLKLSGLFLPNILILSADHLYDDLVEFDPSSMLWIDRSSQIHNSPQARYFGDFAAANGRLCVFGGIKSNAKGGKLASGE